jgi:hypothetical protein
VPPPYPSPASCFFVPPRDDVLVGGKLRLGPLHPSKRTSRAGQGLSVYGAPAGGHGHALTKFHKPFQPRPVTQCPLWVKEHHDGRGDSPPRPSRHSREWACPLCGGRRRWRLRWPRGRRLRWPWRHHGATLLVMAAWQRRSRLGRPPIP